MLQKNELNTSKNNNEKCKLIIHKTSNIPMAAAFRTSIFWMGKKDGVSCRIILRPLESSSKFLGECERENACIPTAFVVSSNKNNKNN